MSVTRTISLPDVTLSYTEWPGRAGPVICLPSLTGHKGAFEALARQLAPDYHLLALDLRGRGDSDKPAEGYGFAYHARDILNFVDALGFDSFTIIGHSFGATVGVYLGSIRPDRVRAMVLIDGGADPHEKVMEAMRPTVRHLERVYPSLEAYLAAMQALPFYQPWNSTLETYLRQDVELLPDGRVQPRTSAGAIGRDIELHFHYSMCLHFPALFCPVLFLRPERGLLGDQGHIFTETEAAAITAWIPECRQVSLPGVNHYTQLLHDSPAVGPSIRAFLDDVMQHATFRNRAAR